MVTRLHVRAEMETDTGFVDSQSNSTLFPPEGNSMGFRAGCAVTEAIIPLSGRFTVADSVDFWKQIQKAAGDMLRIIESGDSLKQHVAG